MPFRNVTQYLTTRSEATLSLGKSWDDKQHLVKEFCTSIDEAQKIHLMRTYMSKLKAAAVIGIG